MDTPSDISNQDGKKFKGLLNLRRCVLPVTVAGVLFLTSLSSVVAAPRFVPGQILIKPKAGLSETNLTGKLDRHHATHRRTLRNSNIRVVAVTEDSADSVVAALRNDPEIEFAERDYIAETTYLPNDPLVLSGSEWHLSQIQAPQAWDFTVGRPETVVAVLDSGVDASQPDLAGQLLPGYDFVNNDSDPADDFGHGTAVAGTIAAAGNNGSGVAGVAFGCRVLPVKVVDSSGYASYSCVAQGIRYAVDRGARVINLSIAGSSASAALQDAVNYAWSNNVVVVASAGNNANSTFQYPAACDHVIAVSATQPGDALASFSSFGSYVSLSAPGENIWTTQRGTNNPYAAWRGTSFASPVVAGVAALVASENPSLSNDRIVSILEQTADDVGSAGYDIYFGFGRVNAYRAVAAASVEPGVPPPGTVTNNPPVVSSDTNAPSVAIVESPKNGARLMSSEIVLAGTAADDRGIQEIQVQINGATQVAFGTTSWNLQTSLTPGFNTVRVRSVDFAGNVSRDVVRSFTYVMMTPATIETSGFGIVVPNLTGKLLEVGKTYKVKAVPGSGQAFAGWSGVDSQASVLAFTMQPNLELVANFVPSPFPAVKGTYAGLLSNTNGVMPASSGYFTLTATASGLFTGKLFVGAGRYSFRGQFDLAGNAVVTVKRGQAAPLTLKLRLDLTDGTDQVTGELTDGGWVAELSGDRNIFNSRLNPAQQAGSHAFILEQTQDKVYTAATGSSAISTGGTARVKGKLSDGRAFSAGTALAKNGDCPLYLSLNRGSEVVIGWLNFPVSSTPTASGTVLWVRTGTNSFAATLQAASLP